MSRVSVSCFDPLNIPLGVAWDGETYFQGIPSASATEFQEVFGEGTGYVEVDADAPYRWLFRTKIAVCSWSGTGRGLDGTMPLTVGGVGIDQQENYFTVAARDPWGAMGEAGQALAPRQSWNGPPGTFGFFGMKQQWLALPPNPEWSVAHYLNGPIPSQAAGLYDGEDLAQYFSTSDVITDYWGVNYASVRCVFKALKDIFGKTYAKFDFSIQLSSYGGYALNSVGDDLRLFVTSQKKKGPWGSGQQSSAGTLSFESYSIPLYQGVSSFEPWNAEELYPDYTPSWVFDTVGNLAVTVSPVKFWSYGGKYDPATGLPT
jgi:hypothetical protein